MTQQQTSNNGNQPGRSWQPTRRQAVMGAGALAFVYFFQDGFKKIANDVKHSASLPPDSDKEPPRNRLVGPAATIPTALAQQVAVHIGKAMVDKIITDAGFKTGNAGLKKMGSTFTPEERREIEQKLLRAPATTLTTAFAKFSLAAPVIEELFFRSAPVTFINAWTKNPQWALGTIIAAGFAVAHNTYKDPNNGPNSLKLVGNWRFATDTVPLSHFIGGMFYWYLARYEGISHAALAHSLNNSVSFFDKARSAMQERRHVAAGETLDPGAAVFQLSMPMLPRAKAKS